MKKSLFLATDVLLFLIAFIFIIASYVSAGSIDDIRVIKISPQDGKAVVKTTDRELKMIKAGDVLKADTELEVVEIAEGRVVFEEKTDRGTETLIVRVENGEQRVERVRKMAENQPQMYQVQYEMVSQDNARESAINKVYLEGKVGSEIRIGSRQDGPEFKDRNSE